MMRQVNSTFTGRNKEPHFLMRPMEHPSSAESPWHITNFIFTIVECKVHLSISSTFHGSWFSTTKEFIYITNTFHHHFALLTNNSLVSFSAFLCYVILSLTTLSIIFYIIQVILIGLSFFLSFWTMCYPALLIELYTSFIHITVKLEIYLWYLQPLYNLQSATTYI